LAFRISQDKFSDLVLGLGLEGHGLGLGRESPGLDLRILALTYQNKSNQIKFIGIEINIKNTSITSLCISGILCVCARVPQDRFSEEISVVNGHHLNDLIDRWILYDNKIRKQLRGSSLTLAPVSFMTVSLTKAFMVRT
jgi:hypothetical protein